jgi:hypothetical protein
MQEDQAYLDKLGEFDAQTIRTNKKCFVYIRKMLILRREMRYIRIEITIYSLRMIMLISGLKLVGHKYLDPVFVSICGLSMAIAVVWKSIKSKKNFYKLEIEDLKGV